MAERIPETVAVDGAMFTIQRASGPDVPALARRIESWWRLQGSEVASLHQGGWSMKTRMRGAHSEVLQWRVGNQAQELLWSSLGSDAAPAILPEPGLTLPAQCVWGRSVYGNASGQNYLQRSARCNVPMDALQAALLASLPTQGWRLQSANHGVLLVDRSGVDGFLSLSATSGNAGAWLVWLRVERNGRSR
ncbi:MAG: hypothetical protein ABIP38_15460 [Steroidobacteraceae bacterium]